MMPNSQRAVRAAPVEGEVGTRRIGLVEPTERAPEETRRERQVVARQRAAAARWRAARSPRRRPSASTEPSSRRFRCA